MNDLSAAQIYEVEGGKLTNVRFTNSTWAFEFEGDLYIEAYAGWRLLLHDHGAKLVLGSRDIEGSDNIHEQIVSYLGDSQCSILSVNNLSNVLQLQFLDIEGNRISLELLSNSSKKPNFKTVVDGEEHFDIAPE